MSFNAATLVFPIVASIMMIGSFELSKVLERMSSRYRMSRGLMGLIAALGADSPEIASAFTAVFSGEHDLGIGIVLGSNLFNIAALIGMGAILARNLPIQRGPLIFNAATSLLVTVVGALTIYFVLNPTWALSILLTIFAAYVLMLWIATSQVTHMRANCFLRRPLQSIILMIRAGEEAQTRRKAEETAGWSHRKIAAVAFISLAAIVSGAIFTVQTALVIGAGLNVPRPIVGSLVVATLSSLPNAYTSAHLARKRNGTAVISEAFNSNTINVIVGFGLPAAVVGLQAASGFSHLEIWWLFAMTVAALLLPLHDGRLSRTGGAVLVAMYAAFVAVRVWV